ncbi:MAG: hypothetical protein K0R00_3556, partial [Herbinix sp.]|nr:hypothetical protein [Herbinix sp.]
MSTCSNRIVGEDYADFIADYQLDTDENLINGGICYIPIDSTFTAVYMPLNLLPVSPLKEYGYKVHARLFGLLDMKSLEDSGVTSLR